MDNSGSGQEPSQPANAPARPDANYTANLIPQASGADRGQVRKARRYLIAVGVVVALVVAAAIVFVVYRIKDNSNVSVQARKISPSMQKINKCLADEHVSSSNWTAYQKAAITCQNKQQ